MTDPLPRLEAEGPVPAAWEARLGPLERVGSHAGVHVLRGSGRFLKVHDEPARGAREAALLLAGLPLRTPPLREQLATADQHVLVLDDVRRGAPRPDRVPDLAAAAALLGRLHGTPYEAPSPVAWIDRTRLRFRDPRLPEPLRAALAGMVLVGDALCHLDLHPSNWILDGDTPVGLLDWSSAGLADPELDLAALLVADPPALDAALDAWAPASGRAPDRVRVALYLWLLLAERRIAKGRASPHEREVAGVPHGGASHARAVPKEEGRPEEGLWRPFDAEFAGHAVTHAYRLHACNDVLRVAGERVLKVFNKPVQGTIFELERHLRDRLEGGPATVPAPERLFRVGPRVAAVYPFVGDARPSSAPRDLERLARAQAAFHALPTDAFPEIERRVDDLPLDTLRRFTDAPGVAEAWTWAHEALPAELPEGFVHGSIHRDHAALLPDGRVAILDLEKVRVGPVVHDAARSAVYAGYRNNDETADPRRIVYYLRAYDGQRPFAPAERAALVPAVLLALLRDVKALGQEGAPAEVQRRHVAVVADFYFNRANLAEAFRLNLR